MNVTITKFHGPRKREPHGLSFALLLGLALMFSWQKPGFAQYPLEGTRQAMYAGSWYEGDGDKLRRQIQDMLQGAAPLVDAASAAKLTAANSALTHPILALVVPHAGYVFSGQAAAHAYKAVQGQTVKRVFLLGPSHHVAFHGAALPMAITFSTPLGDLDVDKDVTAELKEYPIFSKQPEVHRVEHSLEMQLPFIREVFGPDVKIVPIVIGLLSDDTEIRLLAEILKGYVSSTDLVVVSSDFTHYGPRYQYQPFKENIRDNVRKLDSSAFEHLSHLDLDGFLKFQEETKDTICGFYPCSILTAMLPEGCKATLLEYYTSQDTTAEDKEHSVSYLAIAYSGGSWPEHPKEELKSRDLIKLSAADREALLKLARGTVESYVRDKKVPKPEDLGVKITAPMRQVMGAFVTLNKVSDMDTNSGAMHGGKELRGCIGYIWPLKPLYQAVMDNAVSACSRDYRFNSVQPGELKHLQIEISVLTPPRRVGSYHDIVLGRDGMVLFKEGHQSVFLPFVATEFGWTLPETLTQLSKKAGLSADDWKDGAKFDVFQADVFEEKLSAHPEKQVRH